MKSITVRFLLSLASVALSLIVGALALEVFGRAFPDATLRLFRWAGVGLDAASGGYWPAPNEAATRGLIDERLVVYMGFVVATRVVFGLLLVAVYARSAASDSTAESA